MSPSGRASLALACVLLLGASAAGLAQAEPLGGWSREAAYPAGLAGISCAPLYQRVYCVGGSDPNLNSYAGVNYAVANGTGVGAWEPGTPYPTAVDSESCVVSTPAIYCVGGEDSTAVLGDVYYASVSPSGAVGAWSAGPSYPEPTAAASCVAYGGYVYCVGGFDADGGEVDASYYAALASPGLGHWSATTPYPRAVDSESCVASAGYVYCVAGEVDSNGNENTPISDVYFAPLTSSGIGAWSTGARYPAALAAPSCAENSGYVYCVGGFDINGLSSRDAYYAALSPSGVGAWTPGAPYPVPIDTSSCVALNGIYCVGGVSSQQAGSSNVDYVYFAPTSGSTSAAPEFPAAASLPLTLAAVLGAAALALRRYRASA